MKAYQFKITLKGSKPPIWRRVIVPAGLSFTQFSVVINEIMGWSGGHLFEFNFEPMELTFSEDLDDDYGMFETLDASAYIMDEYVEDCPKFEYVYDFGDDWRHVIKMEKVIDTYAYNYPMVIKYKGDMLIEDCGGIYGYYELLEALNDENHPDHEEMSEWAGDPEDYAFDLDEVNEELMKFVLLDEYDAPMDSEDLLDERLKGNYSFKRVDFDDEDVYEDKVMQCIFKIMNGGLPDDEEEMDIMLDMFAKFITANHVDKLLHQTNLTKEEIYEILEVDETTDAFMHMLQEMQNADFSAMDDDYDDDDWDDEGPVFSDDEIPF